MSQAAGAADDGHQAAIGRTALVLAGGASRRMGVDKRGLLVDGVPLLQRAIGAVAAVADEVVVVESPRSPVPRGLLPVDVRLVCDRRVGAGPLAGLEAGLLASRGAVVVAVAGDAPWLEPSLLRFLAERLEGSPDVEAAVVVGPRGCQPLLAAYRRRVGPTVERLLDDGERRMSALLEALPWLAVDERTWRPSDPAARSVVNLNTPDDLWQACVRSRMTDCADAGRSAPDGRVWMRSTDEGTLREALHAEGR